MLVLSAVRLLSSTVPLRIKSEQLNFLSTTNRERACRLDRLALEVASHQWQ